MFSGEQPYIFETMYIHLICISPYVFVCTNLQLDQNSDEALVIIVHINFSLNK